MAKLCGSRALCNVAHWRTGRKGSAGAGAWRQIKRNYAVLSAGYPTLQSRPVHAGEAAPRDLALHPDPTDKASVPLRTAAQPRRPPATCLVSRLPRFSEGFVEPFRHQFWLRVPNRSFHRKGGFRVAEFAAPPRSNDLYSQLALRSRNNDERDRSATSESPAGKKPKAAFKTLGTK
jgi:hypothetical protein